METSEQLAEALEPFVREFERHVERYLRRGQREVMQANFDRMPDNWPVEGFKVTMGECRRARRALAAARA